ncbi:hypothetical protein CyaNS01_01102 [Cyanobium sp. NS01]|nr:hypothetical protein CyaNS01_01102 [Cyanobium sp. NS01]
MTTAASSRSTLESCPEHGGSGWVVEGSLTLRWLASDNTFSV